MQNGGTHGHALLVGCPGANLRGVPHAVEGMAAMLRSRRFAVDVRLGDRATRAGILAGYDDLIANARPDRPAVFYYVGHGFLGFAPTEARPYQGICPTDLDPNNPDSERDFRGITSWELSIKLAQLARQTRNITVILDCCYASQMSRSTAANNAVPCALPHPIRVGLDAHLRVLREIYKGDFDAVSPLGSPDVVRVVACGQGETAFECRNEDGKRCSVFTDALLRVLDELGPVQVSWAAIEGAIRARVFERCPSQTPAIDGPARRRLFSLDDDDGVGKPIVFAVGDGFELRAGRLMGVTRGNVYAVMPSGSQAYSADRAIAEVEVSEPSATVSQAMLRCWSNGHKELTQTAIAIPIRKAVVRRPVRVDGPDPLRTHVETALAATDALRSFEPEDKGALATLRVSEGSLTIEDNLGPLFPATGFPAGLQDAVANLTNLAAAQRLRELEGEHGVSANDVDIEWGTVEQGEPRPMPERGASLGLRDRIYVKVKRRSRELYVHIFNIGIRGRITLLTQRISTMGVLLSDKTPEFVLGANSMGTLMGCGLSWPAELPRSFPRFDEIVVIVSSMPANLQYLETREHGVTRGSESQARDMQTIDGFFMKRLTYLLHPREAALADPPFEIDDDPLRQATLAPETWLVPGLDKASQDRAGAAIAIRLSKLLVDRSCSLGPALRIDALICTRSTASRP